VSQAPKKIQLTSTSYVVLGFIDLLGPSTPYRLKQALERSVADFFPIPHTQFYVEPARLARGGYLTEDQEESGRRRKLYDLTDAGRSALAEWLADPEPGQIEFRFPAMVKIFFGADPEPLREPNVAHHRALAERWERLREERGEKFSPGSRLALETGIRVHRFWEDTWKRLGRRR
jgi:DNA-binding PadR family transcriptional regulator